MLIMDSNLPGSGKFIIARVGDYKRDGIRTGFSVGIGNARSRTTNPFSITRVPPNGANIALRIVQKKSDIQRPGRIANTRRRLDTYRKIFFGQIKGFAGDGRQHDP